MKSLTLLITTSVFLFSSCSEEKQTNSTQQNIEGEIVQEEIALSELTQRNDLYYKKFSDEPYTGKVTDANFTGFIKDGKKEGTSLELDKKTMLWVKYNYKDGVKRIGGYYNYDKKGCGEDACKDYLTDLRDARDSSSGVLLREKNGLYLEIKTGKIYSGLAVEEYPILTNYILHVIYEDGLKISHILYDRDLRKITGRGVCKKIEEDKCLYVVTNFHDNGNLINKASYITFDNGKEIYVDGKSPAMENVVYDEYGNLIKKVYHKDDLLHGEYIEYHGKSSEYDTNYGNIKAKGRFDMGKRVGDWVYYERDGNFVTCEEHYDYSETTLKEMCN